MSPDDFTKFAVWKKDELVIQKFDENTGDWGEEIILPESGEGFDDNQYADIALIVGEEGD